MRLLGLRSPLGLPLLTFLRLSSLLMLLLRPEDGERLGFLLGELEPDLGLLPWGLLLRLLTMIV